MPRVVVCAGTQRGLFVFESQGSRAKWTMRGPYLKGWAVYHVITDVRGAPRVHAAGGGGSFGATTFSADLGKLKFKGADAPPVPPKLAPKAAGFVKKYGLPSDPRVWHLEPGRANEPKVLYAGTAPAALFRTENLGKTWTEVTSLTRHKSRKDWNPGAGGQCLHSIQLDPRVPGRMYVAISAAGTFRSDDEGASWTPMNKAVASYRGAPAESEVGT